MDKISDLDMGADDYINKSFSLPELLVRIRTNLRRTKDEPNIPEIFSFGNIKLDFKKLQAFKGDKEIPHHS